MPQEDVPLAEMTLEMVHEQIMVCPKCALSKSRTRAVPGEGPQDASLMFIGEGPGWYEDQQGRPFVGPAGQLLEQLLGLIKIPRSQVFITNMVKCRPPNNRDPQPEELAACAPYLDRQIELIQPRVIVSLGRHSMARFFPRQTIGKAHGTARRGNGVIYFAAYHPAAALRQQRLLKTLEADFLKIPAILAEAEKLPRGQQKGGDEGEQLRLL
jgi:DNA polymerase